MSEDNNLNLEPLELHNFDINDMNLNESIDESFKNIVLRHNDPLFPYR